MLRARRLGEHEDPRAGSCSAAFRRPLLHATVEYGVKQTYGVELDAVKCQKAIPFVQHTVTMMGANGHTFPSKSLPVVICASAEEVGKANHTLALHTLLQ